MTTRAGGIRTRSRLQALMIGVLSFLLYVPTAWNGFVNYDDDIFVYDNPQVRKGLTLETALWALGSTEHGNWIPLARLSQLADVSLFGMRAGGHHLLSAFWHGAAASLLFVALNTMTGAARRSLTVAALFAVHPLQVESVAWATERSSVLAGFFFSLTLLLWARHTRRPGTIRYAAAVAAGALGLAAKPTLMALPFVLLLLDFWPLGRMGLRGKDGRIVTASLAGRRLLEQAPLLLAAAGAGAVALRAHTAAEAFGLLMPNPLGVRLGNAALSCARYLGKMLWPADLAVFYPYARGDVPVARAAAAAMLVAGLTALALLLARRRPWLAAGWLWFLVTLAPAIGIVQYAVHAMADRYAYLPLAGIALAVVWSAAEGLPLTRHRRAAPGILTVAVLVLLAGRTVAQARLWRDSETLFRHTIAATEGNWSAEFSLALALHAERRLEEAVEHYRAGLREFPYDTAHVADAFYNLGNALYDLRRYGEAVAAYRDGARSKPGHAAARRMLALGNALLALGRHEEAAGAYREAVLLLPGDAAARRRLALALRQAGRGDEADAVERGATR